MLCNSTPSSVELRPIAIVGANVPRDMDEIQIIDTSFSPFRHQGSGRYFRHRPDEEEEATPVAAPLLVEDAIVLSDDARASNASRLVELLEQEARAGLAAMAPPAEEPLQLPAWLQGFRKEIQQERRQRPERRLMGRRQDDPQTMEAFLLAGPFQNTHALLEQGEPLLPR